MTDFRLSVRSLLRHPGFTAMAVAMLAVGIGINAAVFTVTNAVLFKGFPLVPHNDRLVYLASRGPNTGPFVSYPDFLDWRDQARSFSGMALVNGARVRVTGLDGVPQTLNATQVSADTFKILGVAPLVGRDLTAADHAPARRRSRS